MTTLSGQTEIMFKLLFERSSDAIWLLDPGAGVFVDCNQSAVELMRAQSKSHLLQLRPDQLAPEFQPDGSSSVNRSRELSEIIEQRGGHRFEWTARRLDGQEIPLEVVTTVIATESGKVHVVISRDITERKKAAEALLESQRLLASVTDNISEAIYRSSPDHSLIFVNKAYLTMFGYASLEEIQAIPREHLYADAQVRAELLRLLSREGAFANQEIEFVRKDGTRFWGLASSRAIYESATGNLLYHVGAITDITEHKRDAAEIVRLNQSLERRIAERTAELTASEARLRTLIDHAPEAIVVFDGDTGQFLFGNLHACTLYGCGPKDLPCLSPMAVSPECQPDGTRSWVSARKYIEEAKAGKLPVFEWTHRNVKGELIPTEVRLVKLPGDGRNLIRASITDTTERKKAEAELRNALAREKELGQLKSNFVSMVSHEFRTPLGVIISSAEILESYFDRLDADERREQLRSIQKNTRRMAGMMEEVLLLGMTEAGRLEYRPSPMDLTGMCNRVISEVLSATDRKCPIRLVADEIPGEVRADERLLNHILTNLLSNAVKYSPAQSEVELRARRHEADLILQVVDHGMGIDETDRQYLFKAFHRGQNASLVPGTGLGLTIVKRCVELHRGSIEVASAIQKGTIVTVTLPVFQHV